MMEQTKMCREACGLQPSRFSLVVHPHGDNMQKSRKLACDQADEVGAHQSFPPPAGRGVLAPGGCSSLNRTSARVETTPRMKN